MPAAYIKTMEHFLNKRKIDPVTGCWIWTGWINNTGYGMFAMFTKLHQVHRYVYKLIYKRCPKHLVVMHTCDVPLCFNPEHLKLGTRRSNAQDRTKKGRTARGIGSAKHKLTEQQVYEIRKACAQGESGLVLAKRYGITHPAIYAIEHRKSWKHLP